MWHEASTPSVYIFSCFPQRAPSKLRMEFSSSVCSIENGAGRKENHFHRIRTIQEFQPTKRNQFIDCVWFCPSIYRCASLKLNIVPSWIYSKTLKRKVEKTNLAVLKLKVLNKAVKRWFHRAVIKRSAEKSQRSIYCKQNKQMKSYECALVCEPNRICFSIFTTQFLCMVINSRLNSICCSFISVNFTISCWWKQLKNANWSTWKLEKIIAT